METLLRQRCVSCARVAAWWALTFGVQKLEDESLKQLLRDVRLPQDSAPRAVAAPSYSSREVRFAAARLARAGVAPER